MNTSPPIASVVVPTHNRLESVRRSLEALSRQTCPHECFEIIVAANGCSDGIVDAIRGFATSCDVRVLDLPAAGASLARNAGAEAARGALLIFLDDDIDVVPEFVAAHLEAHGIHETQLPDRALPLKVAVGYLPAVLQPEQDFFAMALQGWWEGMFDRIREPGHRFTYRDLLTGNFSVPREHFLRLGKFDERYRCHEDYELGYRLIGSGAELVFAEQATGRHRDVTRLERACSRKREEGRADVQLAAQYPELRPALPLAQRRSRKHGVARWIAFVIPSVGDRAIAVAAPVLRAFERIGARSTWSRALGGVLGYWYERGLADQAGTLAALRPLLERDSTKGPQHLEVRLDLTDLEAAERQLDETRPAAATLCVGARAFGRIAPEPGAERLASRHLRPALARIWYKAYVETLIAENRLPLLASGSTDTPVHVTDAIALKPAGFVPDPAPQRSGR